VQDAYSSHDKVTQVFGARPLRSLDEGLARMADWVKQHGARASAEFGDIEIPRNLPPSWRPASAGTKETPANSQARDVVSRT
jgi:UDP-glucose 4-epimerase